MYGLKSFDPIFIASNDLSCPDLNTDVYGSEVTYHVS